MGFITTAKTRVTEREGLPQFHRGLGGELRAGLSVPISDTPDETMMCNPPVFSLLYLPTYHRLFAL